MRAERFLQAAAVRFDAPPKRFGKAALERLQNHDWPGNVRELENLCWRLAALAPGDTITPADLDGMLAASRPAPARQWEDRTSVRSGKSVYVRVDIGGRRTHKK